LLTYLFNINESCVAVKADQKLLASHGRMTALINCQLLHGLKFSYFK